MIPSLLTVAGDACVRFSHSNTIFMKSLILSLSELARQSNFESSSNEFIVSIHSVDTCESNRMNYL